jgi:dolichol-phosphate mannosyltransferase
MNPKISVIIPLYNEEDNVAHTVDAVREALESTGNTWELVLVDDGSQDETLTLIQERAVHDPHLRVLTYPDNGGQGKAMKLGFREALGEIIATIDADLSYDAEQLAHIIDALCQRPDLDVIVGSPYMPGGSTLNVPPFRLFVSRTANWLICTALNSSVHTATGIFRAYRRAVLQSVWLESDGPEINMEILSKAIAQGYSVREIPAVLRGRERGKSKLRFNRTLRTYFLFSLFEKPMLLFGVLGLLMLGLGGLVSAYLLTDFLTGRLNPERPLMTVMMLLFLIGLQFISFGFLGAQIAQLRQETYRLQGRARRSRQSER